VFARRDPADCILDVAEERGSDLIVIGNKGMTGAERFLLGSVPNKVSHHADIERQIAGELIDALSRVIRAAGGT
jgi:nucleotide-binding universal stress UspA family protein